MDNRTTRERIGAIAGRQHGRIHWRQLTDSGASGFTIQHWVSQGYLTKVLPKVYAVGHTAKNRDADLWAAILYAGPGAMLSHQTAGHHLGIVDRPPQRIEVSTHRRIKPAPGVRVFGQRELERSTHREMPVTVTAQTVLDIAATATERTLRRALAHLDYGRALDVRALHDICGRGRPGSVNLRAALMNHEPRRAHTNGRLEEEFLERLRRHDLPVPELNQWIAGIQVDAYWPDHRLVVELDGAGNHMTVAQLRRDRANELTLRSQGLTVLRYDWNQIHDPVEPAMSELNGLLPLNRRSRTSSDPAG